MNNILNFSSLKGKITFSYILLILLPFILIALYSYHQSYQFINSEIENNSRKTLTQVKHAIESKMSVLKNTSINISFNYTLKRFLYEPYSQDDFSSYEMYYSNIRPLVHYAKTYQRGNLNNLYVYMNNPTIPEGFGSFYQEDRLHKEEWYMPFIESDADNRWIYLANEKGTSSNGIFSLIQKINADNGVYLGITKIDIQKNDLFSILDTPEMNKEHIFITDSNKKVLYGNPTSKQLDNISVNSATSYNKNGYKYVIEHVEDLNIYLVYVSKSVISFYSQQIIILFTFVIIVILAILSFYLVLQRIFNTINRTIEHMQKSTKDGKLVPLEVNRHDEIGLMLKIFNKLIMQINDLIQKMIQKETMQKDAQLKALQAQIKPHFIYNTIGLFSAKSELSGFYEISDAFSDFGKMLRYNMDNTMYTSLWHEIEYVKQYIHLQKLKYEDLVRFEANISMELWDVTVLKFSFQPIVENSIRHGFMEGSELQIFMSVEQVEDILYFTITDNGKGIPMERRHTLNKSLASSPQQKEDHYERIGIQNVNKRIKLYFGSEFGVFIDEEVEEGTKVTIKIPFQEGDENVV
ncbi:sensor histidine kinase [Lederbergia graminis]|uniref:Sensor histidine kinase n=1 Tax=Lederbergia graminis TaxID=735518 RepID=A0ABW0LLX3_9BACI